MNYIIQLQCINPNNNNNLKYGQFAYISDVFGTENKYTKDKDYAYKFISATRVNMLCNKIDKTKYKTSILKTY